ncbi:NINE protein [Xanthobacter versatilis]|uniref:NINE protein n=1 Tax=Xanthobacter autotrophicus (strain ATCC BAA-1158 / Py2) TaxID=78245 RepID=UPI00372D137F
MDPVRFLSRGSDARALMLCEANKKSAVVAYLLWFFLGGLGGHRFYTSAPAQPLRFCFSRSPVPPCLWWAWALLS